jgi:aspartyl-tRNA(Asn)/glutamyl-tRNA(Gln) amidotransferase subunit C
MPKEENKMSKIDDQTLDKLAKLSSIQLDEDRREILKAELEDIVSFVENLNDINVDAIDATFTTVPGGTRLREDIASDNTEMSEHILKHAPKTDEDGHFIVPKIIE